MSELAVIPKVNKICIHTNNVINWSCIKKVPILSSTEEILDYTKHLIHCWKRQSNKVDLQYANELDIECPKHRDVINEEERHDIRVTVKIYLYSNSVESVQNAVESALNRICLRDIDTIIVAFPPDTLTDDVDSIKEIHRVWLALEQFVAENRVLRLGVSDFNLDQLTQLWDIATIKPVINQVKQSMSCAVSHDLMEFARENHIELLTHNDAPVILPDHSLQDVFSSEFTNRDGLLWSTRWVVRYSSLYKNRGVIRSKGYIFQAERDVKKLPYY